MLSMIGGLSISLQRIFELAVNCKTVRNLMFSAENLFEISQTALPQVHGLLLVYCLVFQERTGSSVWIVTAKKFHIFTAMPFQFHLECRSIHSLCAFTKFCSIQGFRDIRRCDAHMHIGHCDICFQSYVPSMPNTISVKANDFAMSLSFSSETRNMLARITRVVMGNN